MAPPMMPMAPVMQPMAPMMQPMTPMMPVAPVYVPPPPPPPPPAQPMIINLRKDKYKGNSSGCSACGDETGSVPRKKVGTAAIMWCLVLSNCCLCCIPLCLTDSCKDTELVCVKCMMVKHKIEANCC